jgi:hypothetical protein
MNQSKIIFIMESKYIFKNSLQWRYCDNVKFVTLLHEDCLKHNIPTNGDTPKLKMEIFK